MELLTSGLQILAGCTILNVWLFRRNRATPYRGKEAKTLREEFDAYGLPRPMFAIVGTLKVLSALGLLAGLLAPLLILPSAILLGILMLGAFAMHLKVADPPKKALPSVILLGICIFLIFSADHSYWIQEA